MIRSMTGYGTAAAQSEALQAAVTVRSLNHRYLDVSVHLSRSLQALETDIKRVVQDRISRGRVELAVQATFLRDEEAVVVAPRPIITGLVRALRQIQAEHALAGEVAVGDVARFPGALEVVEPPSGIDDARRRELLDVVGRALDGLQGMRDAEGAHLQEDLRGLLATIDAAASGIAGVMESSKATRREGYGGGLR